MKQIVLLAFIIHVFAGESMAQENSAYKTYFNARYGYRINYPYESLTPQHEAYNGDGRIFTDKKGNEILRVYGARNDDLETGEFIPLKKLYALEIKGGQFKEHPNRIITYSKLGSDFYVLSGTEKGRIFYQKTIRLVIDQDTTIAEAILLYYPIDKEVYNDFSKEIFKSFKSFPLSKEVNTIPKK